MNPRSLTAFIILSTLFFIAFTTRYMDLGYVFTTPGNYTDVFVTSTTAQGIHGITRNSVRTSMETDSADVPGLDYRSFVYPHHDVLDYDDWTPKSKKASARINVVPRDKPNIDQMTPRMKELQEVHKQRRELVKNVCIRNSVYPTPHNIVPEKFQFIYVNDEYKFLYCSIPKVACTNWKRIMLVLSGKVNTTNPMSITPTQAHSKEMAKYMPTLDMYSKREVQYRLKNYFKFLFVRDPLERLLSAYNNKFNTSYNSYFPQRYGKKIIKRFRKHPSKKALKTGKNVKFPEFVKFILDPNTDRPLNAHWREYYKLCYPCLIQYDAVGKYDTFDDDVDFVLNTTGINKVTDFPRANRNLSRPKTSNIVDNSYGNISSEEIHKLWETYSVDFAMFGYPYPDLKPH